ncbi:MAG: hypothetical protein MRJ93_05180 [Nitrososphaeraceae archaeon]|nr:hypothetical protein [Nitrososphaeraceae archaeon]
MTIIVYNNDIELIFSFANAQDNSNNYLVNNYINEICLDIDVEDSNCNQNKDNKYHDTSNDGYGEKDDNKSNNDLPENNFYNLVAKSRNYTEHEDLKLPQIYPTAPQGQMYRLDSSNPNDKFQVDEEKNDNIFTHENKDGSWNVEYGTVRIDIFTPDSGILDKNLILKKNSNESIVQSWNFSDLRNLGYWYKPSDWKNVEFTVIFKLLNSSRFDGEEHDISLVTRSISHSQSYKETFDDSLFYCGGSSYHNNISNKGHLQMKKEKFHADYETDRNNPNVTLGNLYDKIIGFKGIVYNLNNTAVKLESWVDTENQGKGPYKKVHEKIDNGDWGENMKVCGAELDGEAITWGSPMVILKADDFKFYIYDVQVREIIPPSYQIHALAKGL